MGYFLSGLPHYFLVTSSLHFQISGHKFKCVGVVSRVKRKRVPATVLSLSDSRHWEKGENSRSTDGVFLKGVGNRSSEVVGVRHQLFTSCLHSNVCAALIGCSSHAINGFHRVPVTDHGTVAGRPKASG